MDFNKQSSFSNNGKAQRIASMEALLRAENQLALDMGCYTMYRDDSCTAANMVIQEYKDGTRHLVEVNTQTGEETILKTL